MIEITNLRQGAVLNHNHGVETGKSLRIKVEGLSDHGCPVSVNGVDAVMDGRRFTAEIELTEKINRITARTMTLFGTYSQELTVVWDKNSFKRYNFYLDDHIFTFTDLAKERPAKAFDHFYLKGLKNIHDKYGTKFTLNCFYHNAHHEFLLKDMPDTWRGEFQDNADWLKFSFHAYSEFPDRPYAESSAEEFGRDWDLVQNEIHRFAGESAYIPPCVIHWANIHPAAALEMIRRGTRCYYATTRLRVMGGPSLAERQNGGNMATVQERAGSGIDCDCGSFGMKLHYGFEEESVYLRNHGCYYDPMTGLFFFDESGICCNLVPLPEIPGKMAEIFNRLEPGGCEIFNSGSHEQYSFPYYPNYLPDHLDRIDCTARMYTEYGCKPVFFNEGLLGN